MITSEISVSKDEPKAPPAEVSAAATASTWQKLAAMIRVIVQLPKLVLTIIENQGRIAQAIHTNAAVLNQLATRVSWYENRVPFIRKEYFAFKEQERHAVEKAKAAIDYDARERRRAEMAVAQ